MSSLFGSRRVDDDGEMLRGRPTAPPVAPCPSPEESLPPPPAQSGDPGWLSGLISGARKLVSSVLGSDSATTTISSSSSSSFSSDKDNGHNPGKDENTAVSSEGHNALNQSGKNSKLVTDYLEGSLAIVSEIEPKHVIEQLLIQETFSRDECNKLIKIIQSRVVDFQPTEVGQNGVQRELLERAASNAIDFPESWQLPSPGPFDHQALPPGFRDRAVMEAKKWLETKRLSPSSNSGDCGPRFLNTDMVQSDFDREKSSPVDMAKTYMQSLSSCQFTSPNNREYKSTPPCGVHPYKDDMTNAGKRNYHTFIAGDSHDESRRVRLKSTKNVLNISKFKPINLSAGCLEHETRKVSLSADKGSLDAYANLSPELCVQDRSALGNLRFSGERSFEAIHPLQTEPTHLRAGGDPKSSDPAVLILDENQNVEEPLKAMEQLEKNFVPHDSHILVSAAMKHDGPFLHSGDSFQNVSNAEQTIVPKEEIEPALRSSPGSDMELYVDREGYVKVTNTSNGEPAEGLAERILKPSGKAAPARRTRGTRGRSYNATMVESIEQMLGEYYPSTSRARGKKPAARPRRGRGKTK